MAKLDVNNVSEEDLAALRRIKNLRIYDAIYNPEYHPEQMIKYGEEGYTRAQVCAAFDISKQTYYRWLEKYPEFEAAANKSFQKAQAYAEVTLDRIAQGEIEGANATAQIFKMKSQFRDDYQDVRYVKTDATVTVQNLPEEQLDRMLQAKLKLLSENDRLQLLPTHEMIEGELAADGVTQDDRYGEDQS